MRIHVIPRTCPFHSIIWHFDDGAADDDDTRESNEKTTTKRGDDGENDDDGDSDGDGDDSIGQQRGRAPSNCVRYRTESIFSQQQHIYSSDKYSKLLSFGTIYSDSQNMHNWVVWASNLNRNIHIHVECVLYVCYFIYS